MSENACAALVAAALHSTDEAAVLERAGRYLTWLRAQEATEQNASPWISVPGMAPIPLPSPNGGPRPI